MAAKDDGWGGRRMRKMADAIAVTPSGRVEPALQLQVGWRLFALGRRRER